MKFKKSISILLSLIMIISIIMPISAFADDTPAISVQSVSGSAGDTVKVSIVVSNNPGVLGATLKVTYDSENLTLTGATSGSAFSHMTMTKPGNFASPCNFVWDGQDLVSEDIKDGVILSLNFLIDENAESDTECPISISYNNGDIVNGDLQPISFDVSNGYVSVINYMPGDLNSDKKVNSTDIIMLRRHIAGGYEQTVNELAGNVNGDNLTNSTDIITIRRYVADGCKTDPNGYNVKLLPAPPKEVVCEHQLVSTEYKAPSCTEAGNIAYWHCVKCNKYFSDEACKTSIMQADTIINATGHTVVVDEAVEATYEHEGKTEGSHCSVCKAVIIEQQVIPKLQKDEYSITYHIIDNDSYLKSIEIDNPNPLIYAKEDGLILQNLSVVGYNFLGWFTLPSGGTQVTKINAGETGNKELYAHWEKIQYTIQFESDMVPIQTITHTVGVDTTLPKPVLDKYTFVGWSDGNNNIWSTIPASYTDNIILYANWSSDRNKATAVQNIGNPIVCEDSQDGLIMFTYEIGKIENVPLYDLTNILAANGIVTEISTTVTEDNSVENVEKIASTISNSSTSSKTWTLSKEWDKTTWTSEKYGEQNSKEREEAEKNARSSTGTYCIGYSAGGTNTSSTSSSGTYAFSKNDDHSRSYDNENMQSTDLTTNHDVKVGVEASVPISVVNVKASAGYEYTNNNLSKDYSDSKNSGTDNWSSSTDITNANSNSSTSSKTWNSELSTTNSNTTSHSSSISETIKNIITNETSYGQTYRDGGSNSESQSTQNVQGKEDEYGTELRYFTSKIKSDTVSYKTTGTTHGSYRIVEAGTVHVFGVVVYDIANEEYYVFTYNILGDGSAGDAPKAYFDYSYDGTFDDYENSLIPFEVPYYVNEYVNSRIVRTNGLKIDVDTGIVTKYGDTDDNEVVFIPSYVSVDNGDGTKTCVKINGIAEGLFKNNENIKAVSLGNFVTKIPNDTFSGCTNLEYVECPKVTQIGDNAFNGCTSLKKFTISEKITEIGDDAFFNVPEIEVVAATKEIAQATVNSGADDITLDISKIKDEEKTGLELEVSSRKIDEKTILPVKSFKLQGGDKEYKGLSVKSDAETTIINGITFSENTKIPLELSSSKVIFDRVTVNCNGFALVLKADDTAISVNRANNFISSSGDSVLCKNISISELYDDVAGSMNCTKSVLVCSEDESILENDLLSVVDADSNDANHGIKFITEAEYDNYLSCHTISFDANGGNMVETIKTCPLNAQIGELPVATRDYYTFDGWYTEQEGGEKVTSETLMTALTDITLYAHWIHNAPSAWVLASEAPENAEIVDRNYKYNLTSYTTSSSSSLSGWTKYDTSWVWGTWGSWSGWSTSNPGESDSRQREWRQGSNWVDTSYYVHEYHYYHWSPKKNYIYTTQNAAKNAGYGTPHHCDIWLNYQLSYIKTAYGMDYYGYYDNGCNGTNVWFKANGEAGGDTPFERDRLVSQGYTNYYDEWRYRDRSKIYTYYYKKTENKESSTYPTGDNISDICEYVQYRAK